MKINLVEKSRIDSVDFENLTFGKIFTDHMFISKHKNGEWSVIPLEADKDTSEKARAAQIFHDYWVLARNNDTYLNLKKYHKKKYWS